MVQNRICLNLNHRLALMKSHNSQTLRTQNSNFTQKFFHLV